MKYIRFLIVIILFLFVNVFYVHASCTDEEIALLKEETKNIKITYKHKGAVDVGDGGVAYNYFWLNASNISEDFYVTVGNASGKLIPVDGEIGITVYSRTWDFNVYSNKCNQKVNTIEVFIPTFNMYSLDPLCEGIDGNDFELCGKYYEYTVRYDDFVQMVTAYRSKHPIQSSEDNDWKIDIKKVIDDVLKIFDKFSVYFIVGFIILLVLFVIIVILKKRKKRGVLE